MPDSFCFGRDLEGFNLNPQVLNLPGLVLYISLNYKNRIWLKGILPFLLSPFHLSPFLPSSSKNLFQFPQMTHGKGRRYRTRFPQVIHIDTV